MYLKLDTSYSQLQMKNSRIIYQDQKAKTSAEMLQMYLNEMIGVNLEVSDDLAKSGDIVINYAPDKLNELKHIVDNHE